MRNIELRLIAELMKDARRSDRELARSIGVSQPTVSRLVMKLKGEGVIRECALVPAFFKIGFNLMAITFVKLAQKPSESDYDKIVRAALELEKEKGLPIIMAARGMGLGYDVMVVSVHEDYSAYREYSEELRRLPFSDITLVEAFLVDLTHDTRYRPLTFSSLAEYLSKKCERADPKQKPSRRGSPR
jgi:DNA-binding Lrp family transcriptional regulator